MNRRTFFKMSAASLALPYLETFAAPKSTSIKRFVGIQMPFGFLRENLYPKQVGAINSSYLKHLAEFKGKFTLIDGLRNPGVNGQHGANDYFLTGGSKRTKVNSISLDQEMASHFLGQARFNSITAGISLKAGLSWTRSGIKIPVINSPQKAFEALFLGGKPFEIREKKRKLAEGKSILDVLGYYRQNLNKQIGAKDKERIDQYFSAVRDVEQELQMSEAWLDKPKPKVEKMQFPKGKLGEMEVYRLFMKVFKLALETDSSRILTFDFGQTRSRIELDGVSEGYHGLSHHRKAPDKLEQMRIIEDEMFKILGSFLKDLDNLKEQGNSLLDNTMVLFGSALENPNNHSAVRPPLLLAGGGFKHKNYVSIPNGKEQANCNLYLSMLHKMGIDKTTFGSSTGTFSL